MGRVKEQLLVSDEELEQLWMDELHNNMVEEGDYKPFQPTEQDLINMEHEQSISEIFEGVDLTVEYVDVELVTGETVTLRKTEYEQLEQFGELY